MKDEMRQWDGSPEHASTRLRDLPPEMLENESAWAVGLLREAPTHQPKLGERQRVLLGLDRSRAATVRAWPLRLAATVTLLLAATAITWAAARGHWPHRLTSRTQRSEPESTTIREAEPATVREPESTTAPERGPATAPAAAQPATPPGPATVAAPSRATRARPRVRAVAPVAAAATATPANASANAERAEPRAEVADQHADKDGELVVRAMHALRRQNDPALARGLCDTYLQRHPEGPFAEEALAVTIEAALANGDADAPALGARYLRRYPNGPFRGLAQKTSRATDPPSR